MTAEIEAVHSTITGVLVKFVTSDGRTFLMTVSQEGLSFYDRQSSSGALYGTPVKKSADDIFAWIADEAPGGRKKFKDKIEVMPRLTAEPSSLQKMPQFKGSSNPR